MGSDEERVAYWKALNLELKKQAEANGFFFLNYVEHYVGENGTLNYALSDKRVHIEDNQHVLDKLKRLLDIINLIT